MAVLLMFFLQQRLLLSLLIRYQLTTLPPLFFAPRLRFPLLRPLCFLPRDCGPL
jgi:hypothetical protein